MGAENNRSSQSRRGPEAEQEGHQEEVLFLPSKDFHPDFKTPTQAQGRAVNIRVHPVKATG